MKESWDECDSWTQALILAYDQRTNFEETKSMGKPTSSSPPPRASRKGRSR